MKLRLQPWFTDPCSVFLNNLFKWYPRYVDQKFLVLEWGGGNSTIYFLQKGCRLLTVESDATYIGQLLELSQTLGFKSRITKNLKDSSVLFEDYDLTILNSDKFEDIGEDIFRLYNWSIIVNDGISRCEVIQSINKLKIPSIIILDNTEYCANWGKLERCSAHPERVKSYRQFLRDPLWRHYIFEQPEGRNGHSISDFSGWEAPHRWISSIAWRNDHILAKLMVSHIGLPVVTVDGLDDQDVLTLQERAPFDWSQMKWLIDDYSNVFDLIRRYD